MNAVPARILELEGVSCAPADAPALCGISLVFAPGTFTVLQGGGNNWLLRVLGLLETPDTGDVRLHGAGTRHLAPDARDALRNRHFGFLFAQPFLLPAFSAIENVAMPLFKISGLGSDEARPRVNELLDFVGATAFAQTPVEQLALPEQHCVALARALSNEPDVLIVENIDATFLDGEPSLFARLLRRAVTERGVTVVASAATRKLSVADRVIEIEDGCVHRDTPAALTGEGAPA
jgi:predicted ABC-type transport system involved in lysophospholipase L1 biosynthesis ATPase subunit